MRYPTTQPAIFPEDFILIFPHEVCESIREPTDISLETTPIFQTLRPLKISRILRTLIAMVCDFP